MKVLIPLRFPGVCPPRTKTTIVTKSVMVTAFFTGTKLLLLDGLPREEKFNQDYLLAATVPELSKENSNSKRRADKKN
jgi:hypothetical protein